MRSALNKRFTELRRLPNPYDKRFVPPVMLTAVPPLSRLTLLSNGVSGTGRAENHPLNLNRIMLAEESG